MSVRAIILTGYGLNCDYETDFALRKAGAETDLVHINELIGAIGSDSEISLSDYHILVFGGGFAWADDHGAGVLLATKMKYNLGDEIEKFIDDGKLVLGICNGFQSLVNFGLLPAFNENYQERRVALTYNDTGNFIDAWVNLKINGDAPCVFTKGISSLELPVRHGEGKFYASEDDIQRLIGNNQVVAFYADEKGNPSQGQWPQNPNGSLYDIAGICDSTGRIFGLMPHPEGFHHFTNHPDWTRKKDEAIRKGEKIESEDGDGLLIFKNAVEYFMK